MSDDYKNWDQFSYLNLTLELFFKSEFKDITCRILGKFLAELWVILCSSVYRIVGNITQSFG